MAKTDALITFKELVDGIAFKAKMVSGGDYMRIKQIAIDGYRELNLVVLPECRIQSLETMNSNYIVDMPGDLISLKDVYIPYDNMIWSLTRNSLIPKITQIVNGSEIIPSDWGSGQDVYNNEGVYYASKGGNNDGGYYIEDYTNRRIIFRNVTRSEVLIDYVSSGIDKVDPTYIPISAKGALEMYVMMQLAIFGIINTNLYQLYENEYNKQKSILRFQHFNFTAFSDAVYSTITSGVRR
jgi:hypothetical protein